LRLGMVAVAALLILVATAGPDPRERAAHFADAAIAAYRTYVGDRRQAVEFVTSDAKALERWLSPQFLQPIDVPDLAGAGFALIGGRVTPGAEGPAAFALYANAEGERTGLMVEPFESPEMTKPISRSTGEVTAVSIAVRAPASLTVVGREATPHLIELARLAGASSASR
jgi:anti-sigma factor RsiW